MESCLKINNNKPGFPLAGLNCIYLSVTLALRIGPSLVLVCRENLEVIFTDEIGDTGTAWFAVPDDTNKTFLPPVSQTRLKNSPRPVVCGGVLK